MSLVYAKSAGHLSDLFKFSVKNLPLLSKKISDRGLSKIVLKLGSCRIKCSV